jgi:hypothetical protein
MCTGCATASGDGTDDEPCIRAAVSACGIELPGTGVEAARMADATERLDDRRGDGRGGIEQPPAGEHHDKPEERPAPPLASVRGEDLEPHEALRYVAKLFKGLALFLLVMLVFEVFMGLRQEGPTAIGTIFIEAIRVIVIAGVLWGFGDIAVVLIESNHDLRASRIILGRISGKLDRAIETGTSPTPTHEPEAHTPRRREMPPDRMRAGD